MGIGPLETRSFSLLSTAQDTRAKSFKYLGSFGDGWEYSV
ncbi:hypothetical protein Brsp06_03007 [Brucella sp. NBRC 13694]|nr:hypothetical protein DR92_2290 [Brucella anthropi]SUA61186.1 Uncharacterised protein [Brucella anthropi]